MGTGHTPKVNFLPSEQESFSKVGKHSIKNAAVPMFPNGPSPQDDKGIQPFSNLSIHFIAYPCPPIIEYGYSGLLHRWTNSL